MGGQPTKDFRLERQMSGTAGWRWVSTYASIESARAEITQGYRFHRGAEMRIVDRVTRKLIEAYAPDADDRPVLTFPAPKAVVTFEDVEAAILRATWPDGSTSGFPSKRIAGMIANEVWELVKP